MAESMLCPVCEEGQLSLHRSSRILTYRGQPLRVDDLEHSECALCGADPVLQDQIKRNHRKVVDAKRRMDGLLTGDEVRAVRERLGLSQKAAAVAFGGGTNAFSKYERGDVNQSVAMDRLMRLVALYPGLVNDLRALAGEQALVVDGSQQGYAIRERIRIDQRDCHVSRRVENVIHVDHQAWRRVAA